MNILITGGAGFIGSELTHYLANEHNITVFDNFQRGRMDWVKNIVKVEKGDVLNYSEVKSIVKNQDVVIHLAAVARVVDSIRDTYDTYKTNTLGTLNILEACRKLNIPTTIFASSREVYGEARYSPVDELHPLTPKNPYGVSKKISEEFCVSYERLYPMKIIRLRLGNVYGNIERDIPERVVPSFVRQCLSSQDLIVEGGRQVLDFIHIDDMKNCFKSVIENIQNMQNGAYNVSSGQGITILDLANKIKKLARSDSHIKIVPEKEYNTSKFIADISKIRKYVSFNPEINIERGLKRTLQRFAGENNS